MEMVEPTSLDLRYQGFRIRNQDREARLLASVIARGIEEPLEGVDTHEGRILLNGFKRYRCAVKLKLDTVPYRSLGNDLALGMAQLIGVSTQKPPSILEQAVFVRELMTMHGLALSDVADLLSRSKAWVSTRKSLLEEMPPAVAQILFRGGLSVYSYMTTLRPFMRMNGVKPAEMEKFIRAVSDAQLSVREIEYLVHGYFRGPEALRQQIDEGKWKWALQQMEEVPEDSESCNRLERQLLKDLETLLKCVQRLLARCDDRRLESGAFLVQANFMLGQVVAEYPPFIEKMREFYDRTGHAQCDDSATPRGHAAARDLQASSR